MEFQRDERAAEIAFFTRGDALGGRAWFDRDGACRIGGVAGVQVRIGSLVVGLELLGARTVRERVGRSRGVFYLCGRLLRLRCQRFPRTSGWPWVDRRTAETLARGLEGLLAELDDGEPAGIELVVRELLYDAAPWSAARVDDRAAAGVRVELRLPRMLGPLRELAVAGIREALAPALAPLRLDIVEAPRT